MLVAEIIQIKDHMNCWSYLYNKQKDFLALESNKCTNICNRPWTELEELGLFVEQVY
jgi:hypothetical protein